MAWEVAPHTTPISDVVWHVAPFFLATRTAMPAQPNNASSSWKTLINGLRSLDKTTIDKAKQETDWRPWSFTCTTSISLEDAWDHVSRNHLQDKQHREVPSWCSFLRDFAATLLLASMWSSSGNGSSGGTCSLPRGGLGRQSPPWSLFVTCEKKFDKHFSSVVVCSFSMERRLSVPFLVVHWNRACNSCALETRWRRLSTALATSTCFCALHLGPW